jgi:hypothetical protein
MVNVKDETFDIAKIFRFTIRGIENAAYYVGQRPLLFVVLLGGYLVCHTKLPDLCLHESLRVNNTIVEF